MLTKQSRGAPVLPGAALTPQQCRVGFPACALSPVTLTVTSPCCAWAGLAEPMSRGSPRAVAAEGGSVLPRQGERVEEQRLRRVILASAVLARAPTAEEDQL